MSFSDIINSIGKSFSSFSPWSLIGDGLNVATSLITSNQANKYAQRLANSQISAQQAMNNQNVAAQERINNANVQSQERINQQQLDFAQGINDIMRKDSLNAISNKKADLMRAGYSSASPDLTGFTTASLSSPNLSSPVQVAPSVESEFTPQMADTLIRGRSSVLDSQAKMFQTLSNISLQRAKTISESKTSSKLDEEIKLLMEDNAWKSLEKSAQYAILVETWENMLKDGDIKVLQAKELSNNLTLFDTQQKLLEQQLIRAQTENKYLGQQLSQSLNETMARIANIKADTRNKNVEHEILEIKRDFDAIVKQYADMGINFNSSSMFDSITKLLTSGNAEAVEAAKKTIVSIFGESAGKIAEKVAPSLVGGAIGHIVDRFTGKKNKPSPADSQKRKYNGPRRRRK